MSQWTHANLMTQPFFSWAQRYWAKKCIQMFPRGHRMFIQQPEIALSWKQLPNVCQQQKGQLYSKQHPFLHFPTLWSDTNIHQHCDCIFCSCMGCTDNLNMWYRVAARHRRVNRMVSWQSACLAYVGSIPSTEQAGWCQYILGWEGRERRLSKSSSSPATEWVWGQAGYRRWRQGRTTEETE